MTILDRDSAPCKIGTIFRRARPGPETNLVGSFLEDLQVSTPRGCNTTVFYEPRIESSVPDLVIVVWNVAVARKWNWERSRLKREDFRLMQYLLHSGPLTYSDLGARLNRPVGSNLTRLEAANLIFRVGDSWRPHSLAQSFAARHIIAIEAKISAWTKAVRQAFQNTWFASDSLVLLPQRKSLTPVRSAARKLGVKLCSPGTELAYNHTMPSKCLPRSYMSWLFNEWAWRFTLL
jgi:hypothetical protein